MIKPLNSRTILKEKNSKEKSVRKSGIVLTNDNEENELELEVVNTTINSSVEKGQKVIVYRHSCNKISYNNEKYYIVKDEDILAIVED